MPLSLKTLLRMISYVDGLFNPTGIPVERIMLINLTWFQIGTCPVSLACFETPQYV